MTVSAGKVAGKDDNPRNYHVEGRAEGQQLFSALSWCSEKIKQTSQYN